MIKLLRFLSVTTASAILTIFTHQTVNAQVDEPVSTSIEEFGNLGVGPRVPNFCSLSKRTPCLVIGFNQGFSFPESGTSSNFSATGDVKLSKNFSFVGGGGSVIGGSASNLFASVVARSPVKKKGLGYAVGPIARVGFARDDVSTLTFANGATSITANNRAFFGLGGTAQLIYKPLDTLVFWTGIDASQNLFDGGGIVFSTFGGGAFTIANTVAGVIAGTITLSRVDGDIEDESNSFNVGVVLFP